MDTHAHGHSTTLATDRGRTAAYDAAAGEQHSGSSSTTAEQPLDEAGARESDATDTREGSAASDREGGPVLFDQVVKGLRDAEASGYEASRQTLARAYEDLRVRAVGSLDIMLAHGQLAAAALKWEPENLAAIADHLAQADRCLVEVRNAVLARMQLVDTANAAGR